MTLDDATLKQAFDTLHAANSSVAHQWPGDSPNRQPLHTVYGGAQLFRAGTTGKLGELALAAMDRYAPDAATLAAALDLPGDAAMHQLVWERVRAKLVREPVEDFRIDFEDGFGVRPDPEEDHHAVRAAKEVAAGMASGELPPFIGIRIKPLNDELGRRSVRTLDLFVTTLIQEAGRLPDNFVITLPKIPHKMHVAALVTLLQALEHKLGLADGALKIELMVELPQTIFDAKGRVVLPDLIEYARGRCVGAHFGTYDYTAATNITAAWQVMDHPACDFAKSVMQVALSGTGVFLSDGATNVMPVGPHGGDVTPEQEAENRAVVHRAWKLAYDHTLHSLKGGFYQGWDLHPAQLVTRYAACFSFFLGGLDAATERLSNFVAKAAQATLVGDVFDDAATGQGLLNYFLRAWNSGAITFEQVAATGLTEEELRGRSFVKILEGRK
jgi:citrate lyase beta subunit